MARRRMKLGMVQVISRGRVVCIASAVEAQRLVDSGSAIEVHRFAGVLTKIEKVASPAMVANWRAASVSARKSAQTSKADPEPMRSCVILSKAEVEAEIGLRGSSRTARLSEGEREARVARGLPEMDLVESARRKFHALFPERTQEPSFA